MTQQTANRPVVLITGASSGLGAGMAREFASRGYDLALCARRVESMEALKAEIQKTHPNTRVDLKRLDVTDFDTVPKVFHEFHDQMGRLDRVIINAGIGTGAPVGKGAMHDNIAVIQTNYTAAFAQAEAAMEIFRANKSGHLVVISSMSALRGLRGMMTSYSSSKAAVAAMAEGLRAEVLRKPGMDVSTIYPGYIRTEINEGADKAATPFIIDAETGCRLIVDAIEKRPAKAYVPFWPWGPLGWLMRIVPLSVLVKMT